MGMNGVDPLDFSGFEQDLLRRQAQRPENLILRFFQQAVPNTTRSQEAGREICDIKDFVSIIVPGSRDDFITEVGAEEIRRFGPAYERWKKTQEQPVDGQPLDQVPFLNVAQVREMQHLNVKTLEQLANLTDTAIGHIGMGALELRKKAKAYIEAGKGSAEMTRYVNRISELERENGRLQDEIRATDARYVALLNERPPAPMLPAHTPLIEHMRIQAEAQPTPAPPTPAPPALDIAALIRAEVAEMMKTLKTGE